MQKPNSKTSSGRQTVAQNKRATHEYFIEERLEAGIVLQGWEVKSLRNGRAQLTDSYLLIKDDELWLIGTHIPPLPTASTHIQPDSQRTRKLLLHKKEIERLIGKVQRKGYTLIPLLLYFKQGRAKLEFGVAKGKKQHDKRSTEKERDLKREKEQAVKRY
jgi:SsrA-binding protein